MIAMQVLVFPRWSAVRGVAYLPMLDDAALAARWAHLGAWGRVGACPASIRLNAWPHRCWPHGQPTKLVSAKRGKR